MSDRDESGEQQSLRKQERRRDLIDAALFIFSRDGFSAAKMEDVAAEAGMAKGTVYLYADSKVALFQDVIREKILPVISEVEALFAGHEGCATELLKRQIRRFSREITNEDRSKVMRLIITEGKQFPEIASFYAEFVLDRGMEALKATLRKGMARGEFRELPLDTLPHTIMGGIVMSAIWHALFDRKIITDPDTLYDQHVDVLLEGLLRKN